MRLLAFLKARGNVDEGWDNLLALNFPFKGFITNPFDNPENIDYYNDLPYREKYEIYKSFYDLEFITELEKYNPDLNFYPPQESKYIIMALELIGQRHWEHRIAKLLKTTIEPLDLESLEVWQRHLYKIIIMLQDWQGMTISPSNDKDNSAHEKSVDAKNKAFGNIKRYCRDMDFAQIQNIWSVK